MSAVNDDEAAVREAVDEAKSVVLIFCADEVVKTYHRKLRGSYSGEIRFCKRQSVLAEGLDYDANLFIILVKSRVDGVFVGIEGGEEVARDVIR